MSKPVFHEVMLKSTIWKIFGQVISRVFFDDKEFHRNPHWINISSEYIEESVLAAYELRSWPKPIRGIVANFLPRCRRIRTQLRQIKELLEPLINKLNTAPQDKEPHAPIEWLHRAFRGQSDDIASMIVALCIVSYDAGTESLCHILYEISGNTPLISDLRTEIINTVGKEGFTKSSLQSLVLMDSVMKESQRLHPEAYRRYQVSTVRRKSLTLVISPYATTGFGGNYFA